MSNGIFFYNLSNGIIKYNSKNPISTFLNKDINAVPIITKNNISLIDAQKFLINDVSLCIFDFSANQPNTMDVSRNTIGTAKFFNTEIDDIIDGTKIVYKDITSYQSYNYDDLSENYFGDLDFVEFTIPQEDINNIKQNFIDLSDNDAYIDYYFYIWEDINGPWYDGTKLSMTPSKFQFVNSDNQMNNINSNNLSELNENSDTKFYTYNYISALQSDTSSNYIKIFKISGINSNNKVPLKKSIRIVSPKYTKFSFVWTYKINNSTITHNNINHNLSGTFPYFTPNINIDGLNYNNFENNISILDVSRNITPQYPPEVQYNDNKTISVNISEKDKEILLHSYINRYKPENNRIGNEYVSTNDDIYRHIYENNEILDLNLTFYFFINKNNEATDICNNIITLNNSNINSNFKNILSDSKIVLADNSINIIQLDNYRLDYFDISQNLQDKFTDDIIQINVNSTFNDVSSNNLLINNNKYYAYEKIQPSANNNNWTHLMRSYRSDLINLPKWAHLVEKEDWKVFYKTKSIFPESDNVVYDISDLSQSIIDVRWNFTSRIYTYSKLYPGNPTYVNIYDISSNSGISPNNAFDYTQAGIHFYPTQLLDISFTELIDTGNQLYYNYNISLNPSIVNNLYNNIKYNYGVDAEPIINIYGLIPKKNSVEQNDIINVFEEMNFGYSFHNLFYNTNSVDYNNEDINSPPLDRFNSRPDSIKFLKELNEDFFNSIKNLSYSEITNSSKTLFLEIKNKGNNNLSQFTYKHNELVNTRDISYSFFDISFNFYNEKINDISFNLRNYNIPYHLDTHTKYESFIKDLSYDLLQINDISGIHEYFTNEPDKGVTYPKNLVAGKYIFEWNYDISFNNQIIDLSNVLNKKTDGTYTASKTSFDVSKNRFIESNISSNIIMDINKHTLLIECNPINDLFKTTKHLLTDSLTNFAGNRRNNMNYTFSFTLYTPNNEKTFNNEGWELPSDYIGINDPRILENPTIFNNNLFINKNNSNIFGYDNGYSTDFKDDSNMCILTSIFEQIKDISSIFYQSSPTIRSITDSTLWTDISNVPLIGDISATYSPHIESGLPEYDNLNNHYINNCPNEFHTTTINYDISGDTIIHGYTKLPIILSSYKNFVDISRNPNLWDDKFLFNSFNSNQGIYRSNVNMINITTSNNLAPITFPISHNIGQYYIEHITLDQPYRITNPSYMFELTLDNTTNFNDLSYSNIIVGTHRQYDELLNNQTFIGLYKDGTSTNGGWIYRHNGTSYPFKFISGRKYDIKWICQNIQDASFNMHIIVNNRLIYSLENGGIPEIEFNYLGHDIRGSKGTLPRQGIWNYRFDYNFFTNKGSLFDVNVELKRYSNLNDLEYLKYLNKYNFYSKNRIALHDIAIFKLFDTKMYKIINSRDLNLTEFPLSSSYLKNNNIIPYLSKVEYNFNEIEGDNILESIIKDEAFDIKVNKKHSNWVLKNGDFLFKNYSKIKYGKLFFLFSDTLLSPEPFYPFAPTINYDYSNNLVKFNISSQQKTEIKYSLIDDWGIESLKTTIKYRFFGFINNPLSDYSNNLLLTTGLNIPYNDLSFNELNLNALKNIDIDSVNFDFDFTISLPEEDILLLNQPSLSDDFKYFNACLSNSKIWASYTYIINNALYDNISPNIDEYDISFNILNIDSFIFDFDPSAPLLTIKDSSSIELKLPDNAILSLFNSLMAYSDGFIYFNDIEEIKINYYLWSNTDISNNLPNNYNGELSRLTQNPNTYTNSNGLIDIEDISYSNLLDSINTLNITKTYTTNLNDLNTYDDSKSVLFQDISINYTSIHNSIFPIPYLARWSVDLKLKDGNTYYSDISGVSDIPFIYRKNNIEYILDNLGNKIILNNFNKYNYGILLNPNNEKPPEPEPVYVDPCKDINVCKKLPVITKTKDTLTQVQRYSNAVKYKTYSIK